MGLIDCAQTTLVSLSTRDFETRTASESELFSLITRLHTITFTLLGTVSSLGMITVKIWETPLSWHARCSLPLPVRVSKRRMLKLTKITSNMKRPTCGASRTTFYQFLECCMFVLCHLLFRYPITDRIGKGAGVRFSKVPKTFRARKAIRKTPTCLFCKAGLFICCKGNKNKNNCKFRASRRLSFENTNRIMSPEMRPKSFGTFEKQAPGSLHRYYQLSQRRLHYSGRDVLRS